MQRASPPGSAERKAVREGGALAAAVLSAIAVPVLGFSLFVLRLRV